MASLESTAIDLIQCSLTPATVKCYNSTLVQFQQFLSSLDPRYKGLPANAGHVILFIAELYKSGLTAATITSKMSAISYYHKLHSLPDPVSHFIAQKALAGVRKLASSTDVRLPITLSLLQRLIDSAKWVVGSHYYVKLLRSMMTLCFFALLRPGEVTDSPHNLMFDNVQLVNEQITVTFLSFKHHKGQPVSLIIPAQKQAPCPVQALKEYLEVRKSAQGPLFCHFGSKPITYSQFNGWFHQILDILSIKQVYGLHSFRIGCASLAAARNISSVMIQQMGRWHSNAYARYIRIPVIKL